MDAPNENMMAVAPSPGATVRYPAGHPRQYQPIPAEGAVVPMSGYFVRALNRGDLRKIVKRASKRQITELAPEPEQYTISALRQMRKDDLLELAAGRGLELSGDETKNDLVALLSPEEAEA